MSSPLELVRTHTGLDQAARAHLERLMASWSLLSDLSFSDLLLFVPADAFSRAERDDRPVASATGLRFLVLGQIRPTTSQTIFSLDLVGEILEPEEVALVTACFESGSVVAETVADGTREFECIPVRCNGEVVAVLERAGHVDAGRRPGALERTYLHLFDRLSEMVQAGRYPFVVDDTPAEEAPRVGDGVLVLDANERVSFASPNAVSALHRMGIVAAIIGARLGELGVAESAIRTAFESQVPGIEELERRPDVVVLARTIPLLRGDKVTGAAVLLRDLTDLRRRDRMLLSKDAAIREVHHRVKNNLQTISSLLRLQSRRLEHESARVALLEAERRIQAIALVHEILARDPGEQVPFAEIVPALVRLALDAAEEARAVEVVVEGSAGDVVADVATPLAVVIAELLQNAVEHGFDARADRHPPRVELRFARAADLLLVEVHDNGVGFPTDFDLDRTGRLGLAIVRDLVRSQLGGEILLENADGALVRLRIPLDPLPPD